MIYYLCDKIPNGIVMLHVGINCNMEIGLQWMVLTLWKQSGKRSHWANNLCILRVIPFLGWLSWSLLILVWGVGSNNPEIQRMFLWIPSLAAPWPMLTLPAWCPHCHFLPTASLPGAWWRVLEAAVGVTDRRVVEWGHLRQPGEVWKMWFIGILVPGGKWISLFSTSGRGQTSGLDLGRLCSYNSSGWNADRE